MQGMTDEGEKSMELVAQMEELYSKLGISVYNSNGELKNTFELLETLAPIYQEATAAEKAYITETIAGKYQAQNAAAILNNFETAINATETAMNSQGSAMSENEKVLGSIRGKLSQLGSQFEELSQKVIGSDLVKFFIDLGTAILKFVNSDLGSLTFAITAAALNTRILANLWGMLRNKLVDLANSTSLYKLKLKGVNVNNVKVLASNTTLSNSFKLVKTNSQAAAVGLDLANTKSRLLSLSFNTITTSIKAMSKAMLSNPIFWGTLAVEGIIALANWADKAHKSIDELYNDAKTKYSDTTSELEDVNSELSSITSRIEELQSKGPLSFTEKSELDNLKEQTKELLLQKQLLDEREKKEKEKLEKSAQLKVEDALNDKTTYTEKKEKVTDTSFLNKFQSMFPSNGSLVGENGLLGFTSEDISDVDNYIAALEKLRKQYSNNKLALQMIDEEMNRVKSTVGATQIVEQETSTTVNKAVENNKKSYEDYTKKIQENKDKIKEYQKEIEEYERSNPLVVDAEKKGKTPTFNNDEDKQDYLQYKAAQGSLNALTKENEKYTQSQEQTKKNLKEQAEIYENLLSNTELKNSLSEEQLEKLKSQLIEIYKIIDPNKLKGMKMDEILTSGDYSDAVSELLDFKDAGEVTEEQVESLREKFPEFDEALGDISSEEAAEHMNSLTDSVYNLASDINDTTVSIQKKLSGIASSFDILNSAVDEYNQSGYITASTFASLVDNNLVQYLQVTTDGIIMNANALYQMEAAAKDAQLATWQLAAAEDIHKLALGDTEKLSPIAKTALENLRTQTEANAYSFLDAAGKLALFNQELKKQKEIEKGNLNPEIDPAQFERDADAIIALYEKYAASMVYTSATAKKASVSSGGSSSSSSSSSSSKEWWETEFDKLKEQFDYNEITIEQYISGLSSLLGKVEQGTEAWRKINEELQKQRLTKVEDDYKRGTISLDEYITKLKELIKAYKQGTDAWNELADKIKEGLEDKLDQQKDDLETAEDAAISIIDKEIEKLEDLRDAEEERYDKLIEEKEKANEETERELELARLQEALENAKKEKTKRVWREGLGWVYEADQEAIKEAQEALDEFNKEQEISDLEEEKDNALNAIDDQIKGWEDYKEQWESVVDDYEFEQDRLILLQKLGAETENEILQQKIEAINRYKDAYLSTMKEIEELEKTSADKLMGYTTPKDTNVGAGSTPGASGGGGSAAPSLSKGSYVSVKPGTRWYSNSYGGGISGTARSGTIRYINNSGTHPYNIDGLGWVRKTDIVGYRHGGVVDYTGLAMLHGTKTKPEYVLNNDQMRNMLANFTKPQVTKNVANNTNKVENYNFGNIELPNVNNAQQFVTELKSLINITKHQ